MTASVHVRNGISCIRPHIFELDKPYLDSVTQNSFAFSNTFTNLVDEALLITQTLLICFSHLIPSPLGLVSLTLWDGQIMDLPSDKFGIQGIWRIFDSTPSWFARSQFILSLEKLYLKKKIWVHSYHRYSSCHDQIILLYRGIINKKKGTKTASETKCDRLYSVDQA